MVSTDPDAQKGPAQHAAMLKPLNDIPAQVLRDFLHEVGGPRFTARAEATLEAATHSESPAILAAIAPGTETEVVAVGTATMSMHAFSNWGINLLAIKPGWETSAQVEALAAALVRHPEQHYEQLLASGEANHLALSVGTAYPALFAKFGFVVVHSHELPSGESISWMLRISPGEGTKYTPLAEALPATVQPSRSPEVRLLEGDSALEQAKALVATFWGPTGPEHFEAELKELATMPGSAVYAYYEGENVLAVGAIIKALHHDEAWARAWIVVSEGRRGKGIGEKLIQTLLAHAEEQHRNFSDSPALVMEGFTYTPDYYRKYGNAPIASRELPKGTGTWTARISFPGNPND